MALLPEQIGQTIGSWMTPTLLIATLKYVGYALIAAVILAAIYGAYLLTQYKYKVVYPKLTWIDEKKARIIGWKTELGRYVKKKGNKVSHLLPSNRTIEPFKTKHIQPGNKIFLLQINEDRTYVPMPDLTFNSAEFESLTPEEKYWGILQLKENAQTFQNDEAMKRATRLVLVTAIVCAVVVIVTVWFSLQAPSQAVESVNKMLPSLKQIAEGVGGGIKPP